MTNSAEGISSPRTSSRRSLRLRIAVISLVAICALALAGWSYKQFSSVQAASTNSSAAGSSSASTASTTGYPIKVFFSKSPISLETDLNAVYPVNRSAPSLAVATFSIQLLLAGPTLSERDAGYFSELNSMLSGPSSCSTLVGGPDFTLTLDKKGSKTEKGTATLKFCRTLTSPGIGSDARVIAEINATLKQFSNIKKVVILTKDGHCFPNSQGTDACLQ